ncbi:MAG: alkaline phosphatase [Idiomarina sp.]|nr:alkaline phosphatase [Idiomarina sp.]
MFKRILLLSLLLSLSLSARADEAPRNMIMVIGDGMGFPYLTAYRYFKDARGSTDQADMTPTIFDRYLIGAASTYPADDTLVTDSAASGTALATGYKTYNGAIAVDADGNPLKSMMQYAKDRDFITGTVVTTRVTHATPAVFFSHVPQRRMEQEIARQYAEQRDDGQWKFDIMVGSGSRNFIQENDEGETLDLLADMRRRGMHVVQSFDDLQAQQRLPVLAFMHEYNFPKVIDDQPRLTALTQEALRLIEADGRPFVIMIEAAMIDWCGHSNDIACAMHEMRELEELMEFLVEYTEERGDTALMLTADHSTGGLTLGADRNYQWRAAQVNRIGRSFRMMSTELAEMPRIDWDEYIERYLPFPLSSEHQSTLARLASMSGDGQRRAIHNFLIEVVRYHTSTGWTTGGHTGEDVPVIATGPWADAFRGHQDQTDIARQFIEWIKTRPVAE